jgi:hypothetical protein
MFKMILFILIFGLIGCSLEPPTVKVLNANKEGHTLIVLGYALEAGQAMYFSEIWEGTIEAYFVTLKYRETLFVYDYKPITETPLHEILE